MLRNVFSSPEKVISNVAAQMNDGKLFHVRGVSGHSRLIVGRTGELDCRLAKIASADVHVISTTDALCNVRWIAAVT